VYDRAAYLGQRRAMMQVWADHLDALVVEEKARRKVEWRPQPFEANAGLT
jgi:hypothetical protein